MPDASHTVAKLTIELKAHSAHWNDRDADMQRNWFYRVCSNATNSVNYTMYISISIYIHYSNELNKTDI